MARVVRNNSRAGVITRVERRRRHSMRDGYNGVDGSRRRERVCVSRRNTVSVLWDSRSNECSSIRVLQMQWGGRSAEEHL